MNSLQIKEFRKIHKLTQSDLAEIVGVTVGTVSKWEQGVRNMSKSAINVLVNYEREKSKVSQSDIMNSLVTQSSEVFSTKAGSVYEEMSNGKFKLIVPLVPIKAHATYISEFTDTEYIAELEKVDFVVDRVGKGKYQAFEIQNDSMNDGTINSIPDGAIVLGRELGRQHWKSKFRTSDFPYWIIVHKDTILCKEIIKHDVESGTITCHSLNTSPEYPDFEINLNDVYQLFNIVKKQW